MSIIDPDDPFASPPDWDFEPPISKDEDDEDDQDEDHF